MAGDLHREKCSSQVRNTSLILTDDTSAQTGTREVNRSEGANLPLDSGSIDSDTADLIQRSRIDDAAELGFIARIAEKFSVEDSSRQLIDEVLNCWRHWRKW